MFGQRWTARLAAGFAVLISGAALRAQESDPNPQPRRVRVTQAVTDVPPGTVRYDVVRPFPQPGQPPEAVAEILANNFVRVPPDAGSGVTLELADESLRAQLGLPAGQGLVVTGVNPEGPAARAGLTRNDILLTLADKPLGKPEDLDKSLKDAGDKPVKLRIIRGGKPLTLEVRPVVRVVLGRVVRIRNDHFIGVQVSPVDESLRVHLDLPAEEGLIVTSVQPDSPAAKAGLKAHDVLLNFADKPLTSAKALVEQIQSAQEKPAPLKVLRAGKTLTLTVTPEKRKLPPDAARDENENVNLFYRRLAPPAGGGAAPWVTATRMHVPTTMAPPGLMEAKVDELMREVRALRQSLDRLQKSLKDKDGGSSSRE
jgi:serine protease Do